jgi:hypothetical protein
VTELPPIRKTNLNGKRCDITVLEVITPDGRLMSDERGPLGRDTAKIVRWFSKRGWTVLDGSDNTILFEFTESFGGDFPDDSRAFGDGMTVLSTLDCLVEFVDGKVTATISTCGVERGCPRHREQAVPLEFGPGHPRFRGCLERWEWHAIRIDRVDLATCLVFGPCGDPDPATRAI